MNRWKHVRPWNGLRALTSKVEMCSGSRFLSQVCPWEIESSYQECLEELVENHGVPIKKNKKARKKKCKSSGECLQERYEKGDPSLCLLRSQVSINTLLTITLGNGQHFQRKFQANHPSWEYDEVAAISKNPEILMYSPVSGGYTHDFAPLEYFSKIWCRSCSDIEATINCQSENSNS